MFSPVEKLLLIMAITLAIIDIYYYIVDPHLLSLFFFVLLITHYRIKPPLPLNLTLTVLASLAFFCFTYFFPYKMGVGDIKLLICWSLFLTYQQFVWLLFISSLSGLMMFVMYFLLYKEHLQKIPFVPFLAISLVLVLYYF